MPPTFTTHTTCALCNNPIEVVLGLQATPPANELLTVSDPNKERYALNLSKCTKCSHLQLDTEISMFRLFKNYVYTSNTSANNLSYLHQYADTMSERFHPKFVVDIGSNDGTFLHFFTCKTLGVDPAENIVEIARQNGVETECTFFNQLTALDIKSKHGKADLITCNNMFAHNRNLGEVLLGVKELLSENGTFVFEVSYAMKMLKNNLFDLIYHEHYHHWNLLPAMTFLSKFDLQIFDAEEVSQTHGGSIRIFAKHAHKKTEETGRLKNLQQQEAALNTTLKEFVENVPRLRDEVSDHINDLVRHGHKVSILGYPAKACTLSYYFGLDDKLITSIYDNNVLKIGKFAHNGIKIKPETYIYKDKPDYLLILSWNYKDELMKRHKLFKKIGGSFIVPLPKFKEI